MKQQICNNYLYQNIKNQQLIQPCKKISMLTLLKSKKLLHFTTITRNSLQNYKTLYNFCNSTPNSKSNLQLLYQMSKNTKTPFFTTQSHLIQIIEDPIDFYMNINAEIKKSIYRIGLSSLYLGTGTLQRYLLKSIQKRLKSIPSLHVTMLFDYNRSQRKQKGETSLQMINHYFDKQLHERIKISLHKQSISSHKILGQISGVHHQKIAIFDNTIIIGGANLSHNYFLNRKDRYMKFKQNGQLGDYLYDYLCVMAENSYNVPPMFTKPQQNKNGNLQNQYKLWKFSYTPEQYKQNIVKQQKYLHNIQLQKQKQQKIIQQQSIKQIPKNRNVILLQSLRSDLQPYLPTDPLIKKIIRQQTRQKLFKAGADQNDIGNHIMQYQDINKQQQISQIGKKVYIFPFLTHARLGQKSQHNILLSILQNSILSKIPIKISSGYLNLTSDIIKTLKQSSQKTQILCSAPQANSFYRGGILKKYIPYFYRNFQGMILQKYNNKFIIKQYCDNKWSFHAKGIWLKQNQNNYTTIIGSSNFNNRSKNLDTQLQFYLYSTCQQFNTKLDKQWQNIQQHCKQISLQSIKQDKQIKYNTCFQILSKIFSSFL